MIRNLNDLEKPAVHAVVGHADARMDSNGAETADVMREDTMTWSDVAEKLMPEALPEAVQRRKHGVAVPVRIPG